MLLINLLRLSEEDFTEISDAKRWPVMKYLQGGPKSGTLFKYVMQLHVIFARIHNLLFISNDENYLIMTSFNASNT